MGRALPRFLIFCNRVSSKPFPFSRLNPIITRCSAPGRSGPAPDAAIHARCQFAQNHAEKSRRRRALRRRLQEGLAVGSVRRDWMRIETEAARHRASQ
jgi:hypothetical protein